MEPDGMDTEPAVRVGGVVAAASALVALAVSLGLPITEAQQSAILAVLAAATPLVVALLVRRRVYAPATVARLLRRAASRHQT